MTARDHLLMTLAPVALGTRVVVSGCGDGALAADLDRLGLDVWACDPDPDAVEALRERSGSEYPHARYTAASPSALGYPDEFAAWGALDLERAGEEPAEAVAELSRTVAFGGWIWVRTPGSVDDLMGLELPVGVVPAEAPRDVQDGAVVVFRRVDADVVA